MKRIVYLMCFASLLVGCVGSNAQQRTYPEDVLHVEYPYFTTVKFEGNSPDITDFVTSLVQDDGMPMDSEDLIDIWNRYLRHEQQERLDLRVFNLFLYLFQHQELLLFRVLDIFRMEKVL